MIKKGSFRKIKIILAQTVLTLAAIWFVFSEVDTNGVWEVVLSQLVFFLILPLLVGVFLLKEQGFPKKIFAKKSPLIWAEAITIGLAFFILMALVVIWLNWTNKIGLNYLVETDWYFQDGFLLYFIDLFLLPVVLFSQEFFLRGFLAGVLRSQIGNLRAVFFQAAVFVFLSALIFDSAGWVFLSLYFIWALFSGWIFVKFENILISFVINWIFVVLVDLILLYNIEQMKNQLSVIL
jgi:membrane protease YdiL (CAAX protease family)